MKELSICMTHINRKKQLMNTLQSIQNQEGSKELCEIIIVDDVSEVPLKLSDFTDFDLDIKLISIQTRFKWWVNPCVGFNTAFNFIHSEKVIIQNAECLHASSVIHYVINNLQKNEYVAMSAVSLSEEVTKSITPSTKVEEINIKGAEWYCHSKFRPKAFNFCAALNREDLIKIGGFDNRFSEGVYYDDDRLLESLSKNGIKIRIEDSQVVYHQWHDKIWQGLDNYQTLRAKNKELMKSLSES